MQANIHRDLTSIYFGECQKLLCEHFLSVTYFLVRIVHQGSLLQEDALQKYIVLPFVPCEAANFQGLGGEPPPYPP